MRYLDGPTLREVLSMDACIASMRTAFGRDIENPVRTQLSGSLVMPGRVGEVTGVKVVSTVPGDPAGIVVVFGPDGSPLGLVDGPILTALRTAAGAGLATDLLAPRDDVVLAMLGAGAMAADQIAAVRAVRNVVDIRIWSRTSARARSLAEALDAPPGLARPVPTPAEALDGATVVTTATPATAPLFSDDAAASVRHVNAVGAFTPSMAEIPPALVQRSFVVVDDRAAAAAEAGDLLQAGVDPDATIGELLAGAAADRTPTLFKSVGIASQDVAAAAAALHEADRRRAGVPI